MQNFFVVKNEAHGNIIAIRKLNIAFDEVNALPRKSYDIS